MSTPGPAESKTGVDEVERTQEERYASEAWLRSNRAHRRMTDGRHLAARHIDRESQAIGEALYMHTLWILKWARNDSLGSKINRRAHVEAELGISMGETGEDWQTTPIVQCWVMIKEKLVPHVLASPLEMWVILMGWNQNKVTRPRRKLRIGMTRTVGGGWPAVKALTETVDAYVAGRSLVEIQNELGSR